MGLGLRATERVGKSEGFALFMGFDNSNINLEYYQLYLLIYYRRLPDRFGFDSGSRQSDVAVWFTWRKQIHQFDKQEH